MAAYAALVSLMNLIDQIQNHPRPPINLDNEQAQSLTEKIASLQDFLEAYNLHEDNKDLERLRGRVADVAYAAEDIIESYIVHQIQASSILEQKKNQIQARSTSIDFGTFMNISVELLIPVQHQENDEKKKKKNFPFSRDLVIESDPQSTSHGGNTSLAEYNQNLKKATEDVIVKISSVDLYEGLHKVIQDMDSITKDVLEIKDRMGTQDQLHILTTLVVSSSSPSTEQNTMVGCDDVLYEVLDKLTGQQSRRQIISISGMGGIGKTTLARNVYTNPLIEHHFDVRAWVTISKEYNICEILLKILLCLKTQGDSKDLSQKSEQDLGSQLHKCLSGKRYLIIMDDTWSVEVWNNVKFYFPNNNNRSRIIITTRISKLASDVDGNFDIEMSFLDRDESWDLFCKTVFREQGCPDELKQIGKRIAENCKGLPLSIVVIGGLAKSKQTRENWEYIAENLNSVVNLDDNERCLKILRTSYSKLPIHLKPCFLFMGSFPEDGEIDIFKLIKQWVAEGFLKPSRANNLEETAEEYLTNLIERNLILVSTNEWHRKPISCKIHDLLRDLCIREAQKENFLYVTRQHSLNIIQQDISTQRRVAILENTSKEGYHPQILYPLESVSVRSLICHFEGALPLLGFRLLRVLKAIGSSERPNSIADILQLINSRYLDVTSYSDPISSFPSSVRLLWNLQTLIVTAMSGSTLALSEFWMMPLLRHVEVDTLSILSPCSGQMDKQDDFVMYNLQTLSTVIGFKLSEEVVTRIPNVNNLKIHYQDILKGFDVASYYCLNNLGRLHKLEYLKCSFELMTKQNPFDSRNNMISFPNSLKELSLSGCMLDWEDVNVKIGSLTFLQRLTLAYSDFTRSKWETVEGQFTSLEYLSIDSCFNLRCWTTERTHFPSLEHLYIYELDKLDEIPSGIGDIPTLQSIRLERCSDSAVISAKQILEEQEEIGNDGLQVRVILPRRSELKELSSSGNFHVEIDQW